MGCDIHLSIEFTDKRQTDDNPYWIDFGQQVFIWRDYRLFTELANVRGSGGLFQPRGLPDNLSWGTSGHANIYVIEAEQDDGSFTHSATPQQAARYISNGSSKRIDDKWITHPDWHSHSWLNLDELKQVQSKLDQPNETFNAVVAAMDALESSDKYITRAVFWFDN